MDFMGYADPAASAGAMGFGPNDISPELLIVADLMAGGAGGGYGPRDEVTTQIEPPVSLRSDIETASQTRALGWLLVLIAVLIWAIGEE
jgi:hypothetical protein